MRREPLVSAIMPTYNMARYISEAIESIIGQTYGNWELIIIDDGSTDDTENVVRSFRDPRIRYYKQVHRGRGAARNVALQVAKGKYIAITDADDISLSRRFELQVSFLEANPAVAVVGGQILHFVDGKRPVQLSQFPISAEEVRARFRRGTMGVPHCAAMIRADVFKKIGTYSEECLRAQDLELFLRIAHHYDMANLASPVVLYRNDPRRTAFPFWIRLHLFHEYALYRYRCVVAGRTPEPFQQWCTRSAVWFKVLTWHTLRFFKGKFAWQIRWWMGSRT